MRLLTIAMLPMLLVLGTPAYADCKMPVADVVSMMTEKTGEDYASSKQLDDKQYETAKAIVKKYATTVPDGIMGDGALFITTAAHDQIFVAFTHDGKVCGAVIVPMKLANAIVAADISLAGPDAPDEPPAPPAVLTPKDHHGFEHHDTIDN